MIIGVDADGVLTDMQLFNYTYGQLFFNKEIINPSAYSVREIFEVSKFQEILYGLVYFKRYCTEWEPREGAAQIINNMKLSGNTICEITARKFVTNKGLLGTKSRKWFEDWCRRNNFSFDEIIYCSEKYGPEEKYQACIEKKVDVMIDDRPEIVTCLASKGIKVMMMDAPYNQHVVGDNIIRAFGWDDIYQKISDFGIQ